jgi:uncharacterized protein YndB with AHSA1/START domain
MGSIEKSATFPVPPAQLWDVVGNPARYEEWLNMHVKWKGDVPEQLTKGASLTEVVSVMNMPNTINWIVDDFEDGALVKLTGTGMAGVKISLTSTVSSDGNGGSEVTFRTDFSGQMLIGPIGMAVEKAGAADIDKSLEKLTALLG